MFKLIACLLVLALPPASLAAPYCAPAVLRDQLTPFGYLAIVYATGCPALVRKKNWRSGSIEITLTIRAGAPQRIWLFTHRLQYSLDGKNWQWAEVR